ncbi:uncharacterized protein [Salminus brasiliensis]|uniref:uncharacterized protein n=1 Tax=Salminus brasiliensis TaxID=930266 RepID=UPI003B8392F5
MVEVLKLIFALSTLVSDGVSSDVFRMVGDFVQMNIQGPPPQLNTLSWVFNRTDNVLEYFKTFNSIIHNPAYKDRVDFNEETYSLTLKNLQKNDSGPYEARASGIKVTVAYSLFVLDPVKTPVLSHQRINSTCRITCTGHEHSISFNCSNATCEEKEEKSPEGFGLSLSMRGSSIICNHSNQVSWNETMMEMETFKQLCADKGTQNLTSQSWLSWLFMILIVAVLVILAILCYRIQKQRRSTDIKQCENTVYATVESNISASPETMLETPSTLYSVVEKKTQPTSNEQPIQITENQQPGILETLGASNTYDLVLDKEQVLTPNTVEHSKPETIYAAVTKSSKAVNEN